MDDQSKYQDPDWIDAYLLEQLSESQVLEFEEALKSDADLRNKVDEYRAVKEGVEDSGREELKERLKALEGLVSLETKVSKRTAVWYSSRIAAVIILLILPFYFILSDVSDLDSEEVFASHFKPYPVLANGTVRGEAADDPLADGLRAYENGDYELSIITLENTLKQADSSNIGNFYLALSYLANEDAGEAIHLLQGLAEDRDFNLYEQAKWYIGLAFLKNNQPEEARNTFQSLYKNTSDPSLKRKAERILADM